MERLTTTKRSKRRTLGAVLFVLILLLILLPILLREASRSGRTPYPALQPEEMVPIGDSLHPIRVAAVLEPGQLEVDSTGKIVGNILELAAQLLEGRHYLLLPVSDREEGIRLLKEKRAEIVALQSAASVDTPEGALLVTEPISHTSYALLCPEDSLSWSDLLSGSEEVEVCYSESDSDARLILENLHDISYTAIRPLEVKAPPAEVALRVVRGESPCAMVKKNLALSFAERFPTLRAVTDISFDLPQVWLLRPDATPLRDSLNARIRSTNEVFQRD